MADITASMVKDLREKTGAGMMDCKKALSETGGDLEAAVDWLRAKGIAKAARKASRVAAEGLIGLAVEGRKAALVEVNSETDFVARNPDFQAMVNAIAAAALKTGGDVEKLRDTASQGSRQRIADKLAEMVATIGENMTLRRTAVLSVEQGVIGSYLHNQIAPGLGKIGVLVAVESTAGADKLASLARQLAMHIAASNPVALDLGGVAPEVLEREKAILAEKNAGKPANVLQRIFESGLKSFAKEHTLLEQAYVHDGAKSVAQVLKEAEAQIGAPVRLAGFVRYQLGEGIEKDAGDFAAEVAKAAQGS
ncbi:MAG TPA: translation elongation factor Ts [Aestuariivirgaceae bacterium]|jgi:elongation factor Ts|nr:translation elongation factor Ts [Aestuariivirgaceae bacterium]